MAWKLADEYTKEEILELLPQHGAVRPGRLRHRGGRAGLLRQDRAQGRRPRAAADGRRGDGAGGDGQAARARPGRPRGQPGLRPEAQRQGRARTRWTGGRTSATAWSRSATSPRAEAAALAYPDTVRDYDPSGRPVRPRPADRPGRQPRAERAAPAPNRSGTSPTTTCATAASGSSPQSTSAPRTRPRRRRRHPRQGRAPRPCAGQPANWQAALVAVEPGTGRVLAYYGGNDGTGADYAGWYFDEEGKPAGFGQHPPGSSFKVYDLAEALRQKISPKQRFDSPATKEFPASGRTSEQRRRAGPQRRAARRASRTAPCRRRPSPRSTSRSSSLTEQLGVRQRHRHGAHGRHRLDVGQRTGQPAAGAGRPARQHRRGRWRPRFSTEVGIGQYGITVLDHANGMATFAAGGKRAEAHFVRAVSEGDDEVYAGAADPDRDRARPGAGRPAQLDAAPGAGGEARRRLGRRRQDRHLAGRQEHHAERARLDGRLHRRDRRRGLAGHHGRQAACAPRAAGTTCSGRATPARSGSSS